MAIFHQQLRAKTCARSCLAIYQKGCARSCLASSTVHEVAWQFNNLACSCGPMLDRVISTIAFRSLFSSIRLSREQNYTEIVLKHAFQIKHLNFAKYLIEVAEKVT